jgi:hypothetical protein
MNRAQKGALMSLSAFLLSVAIFGHLFVRVFVLRSLPESGIAKAWPLLAFVAMATWWIVLFRKRQSPAEPEADERDALIMRRAAQVAFVATWVMLAVVTLVLGLMLGQAGAIPVYVLTFIHLGLALAALAVYSAVALFLYGRASQGDLS